MSIGHHYRDLIRIFNHCFALDYGTQLLKGEEEPMYLPADTNRPYHAVCFAHGFFSSALHECAHWLLAGPARRLLVDYGYWYIPDGRTAQEQLNFQAVEVKPQAIEWILSVACAYRYQLSVDNLHGETVDIEPFKQAIHAQIMTYCQQGLPPRVEKFRRALCDFYGQSFVLCEDDFLRG